MTKGDSEIELVSGNYLDLLHPDPTLITSKVIGWHLSQQNRFAGACRRPYSVAEHSILVARRLHKQGEHPETVIRGLHHDDSEAFLGDWTRPLKAQVDTYRFFEKNMQEIIVRALELPVIDTEQAAIIKRADTWALAAEAYYLMPSRGMGWQQTEGLFNPSDRDDYWLSEGLRVNPRALIDTADIAKRWRRFHDRYMRKCK